MEKNIKDYLHLYLGCECYCTSKTASKGVVYKLVSVGTLFCEVSSEAEERTFRCSAEQVKPILRPISDMTEEEGKVIAQVITDEIFGTGNYLMKSVSKVLDENDDGVGFIMNDEHGYRVGLTIEPERGIEYSNEGQDMKVRQFDVMQLLLSKHFDLFSLIDSNLAIDKTKLPTHA